MQTLEIEELKLYEGQRLSVTEPFKNGTPTDRIIFKVLPGIGATHGEILLYNNRNSIIMEVNVPVIQGKETEKDPTTGLPVYPNMLGVYEGVTKQQVEKYLNSDVTPKKIVCTPEAYEEKVKPAIANCAQFNIFEDFFLLLDECDKLITEVDYRGAIVLPMDDFFQFKNKAMVSATALIPSDPRFLANGFKILKVVPQFKFAKTLNLVSTNNATEALRKLLTTYNDKPVFIFINSTDLILAMIRTLGIENESMVFCASTSVRKLRKLEYWKASDKLPKNGCYAKYNFLTSRFFSAVDIKVPYKPNIIVITNVLVASQTVIDPYTESIQVTGRLRNGVTRIAHITNYKPSIEWFDRLEALKYIHDGYTEYTHIVELLNACKTEGGKDNLIIALNEMYVKKYVDGQHRLMPYMVDNYIHEQTIRSLYANKECLTLAYEQTKYFTISPHEQMFPVSDAQLLVLDIKRNKQKLTQSICEVLLACETTTNELGEISFYLGETRGEMQCRFPEIVKQYDTLGGFKGMARLGFNPAKIKREVERKEKDEKFMDEEMRKEIRQWYNVGDKVLATIYYERLKEIYTKYEVTNAPASTHIQLDYDCTLSTNSDNHKEWTITGVKE